MINVEKIDKIIDGLEKSANEFKNVTDLGVEFEKSMDKVDNTLKQLQAFTSAIEHYSQKEEKLDLKVDELNNKILDLISKLQDIRVDYHKVSTSYEIVEGDLNKFNGKLDDCTNVISDVKNQTVELVKNLTKYSEQIQTIYSCLNENKQKMDNMNKKINILGVSILGIGIVILICVIIGLVI